MSSWALGARWRSIALAVVIALLTVRAWWVPRTAAKPLQFGLGEFAASVVVGVVALGVLGVVG